MFVWCFVGVSSFDMQKSEAPQNNCFPKLGPGPLERIQTISVPSKKF